MPEHDMCLKNLTMFDFSEEKLAAHGAMVEAEIQEYKVKYGEDWEEYWHADIVRKRIEKQDAFLKLFMNCRMYDYGQLHAGRCERLPESFYARFDRRAHEVYGDRYDELCGNPAPRNPIVAELLIQDALRMGDRDALPEELKDEYDKRTGQS